MVTALDLIVSFTTVLFITLQIVFMIIGYESGKYIFRGYKVKHIVFFGYILGRSVYKILNIQLTNGE